MRSQARPSRGTALICEAGHVRSWFLEDLDSTPNHCPKCGAPLVFACPACAAPIPGAPSDAFWSTTRTPPRHCEQCGEPFPWRAAEIAKARAITEMQAAIYDLDPEEVARYDTLAGDAASGAMTQQQAETTFKWFSVKKGAETAKSLFRALVDIGEDVTAKYLAEMSKP
jgi:hypothetical protein